MTKRTDIQETGENLPSTEVGALLQLAVDKNLDVEKLEKLLELKVREEERYAAREFAAAMAQFQTDCPPIPKTSTANVKTANGASFTYTYAELDQIARTIQETLHGLGFSYGWDVEQGENNMLSVTCTLRHQNGHKETATFACPVDGSPAMSQPQKYASTLTFARRYSLIQVLGLTTAEPDRDESNTPRMTAEQVEDIRAGAASVKMAPQRIWKLLSNTPINEWSDLEQLPAAAHPIAMNAIKAKREANEAKEKVEA